jgi:FkbM family methyltransferase
MLLWREVSGDSFYRRAAAAAALRSNDTVLDIGANIGLSSILFGDVEPAIRVISVEPAPAIFACLARNLAAHLRRGHAVQAAVGASGGTLPFTYYPEAPGNSGLYADREADDEITRAFLRNSGLADDEIALMIEGLHVGETMTVEVTTVSELLRVHDVTEVALLKIDVERAELDVLRGIADGDWPRIRSVVAEVHGESRLTAFSDVLRARGFALHVNQDAALRDTGLFEIHATRAGG